ncbi:MAG: AI-2E family transporter [Pseudomonadales bacterium]|nr:AI-2E family transporter [Halioglobus sp.]MCP5130981.1 AI-2E family transporter [Pseudomonadales bacterium]
MEERTPSPSYEPLFIRNMIESTLRIGLLFILLMYTYEIIKPFTTPFLWGGIIAMAAFPLVKRLQPFLGGRRGLAATVVTIAFIAALTIPTWSATEAGLGALKKLTAGLESGELHIPPPAARVKEWPVIGEQLYTAWSQANSDLQNFLHSYSHQITEMSGTVLKKIGGSLMSAVMFVVALLIAGGLMTYAESCGEVAKRFFVRIGGLKPGGEWAPMIVATVRNVLQGVVGVAIIQTILVSIGLVVAGIPGAPLWSMVVLVLAVAQLPLLILMLPIIVYAFSTMDSTWAVVFAIYISIAASSDSFLKPLLMGRGLDIPMPIILFGAIGGMIMSGIIGLFVGAVVLSIAYKLLVLWLQQEAGEI